VPPPDGGTGPLADLAMETLLQSVVSGILTGSLYAMIAVGLTIVFGVMRIINMAHAEMVMLGMFGAFWTHELGNIDPFFSLLIWMPAMFAFGMLVQRFLLKKIIPSGELNTLLYTAGLSLLIANLALFFWTGNYRNINLEYGVTPLRPFGISISVPLAIAFVLAIVITSVLYLFLSRTDTGRAIRATAQNPASAALMGVNVQRIDMITFGLGTGLAGAAGVLLAPSLYLYPTVGEILIVKCFVIVVLGGLGSIPGAIAGGVLLGLVESLGAVYVSVAYKDTIGFVLFLLVLLFRPAGLFGVGRSR
jgi:branched-chain amino acid transport system permease protein